LIALQHEDLKAMGINSVGHRLTILKSVYDVKKAQDVPIESDHYMPLSTFGSFSASSYGTADTFHPSRRGRGPVLQCDIKRHQAAGRADTAPRREDEPLRAGPAQAD
jgi:hypothetical protein